MACRGLAHHPATILGCRMMAAHAGEGKTEVTVSGLEGPPRAAKTIPHELESGSTPVQVVSLTLLNTAVQGVREDGLCHSPPR